MTPEQATDLARIARLAFESNRVRMAELQRSESRLLAQIEEIGTQARLARDKSCRAPDAMTLSGRDQLWERWIEARRSAIQTELARVKARKADLTADLRQAYGREMAADELRDAVQSAALRNRGRRSAWSE